MKLRVSMEVDPGVFDESELGRVGAFVAQRHHIGWLSLRVDADRLADLRGLPGVVDVSAVLACDEELVDLSPAPEWSELAAAACGELLRARLEAGRWQGRVALLRQTLEARQKCFARSHRTDAQDIVVLARGAGGSERVVCRRSDGLRDLSVAGMHDMEAGETHVAAMWVGHLPAGPYRVRAGIDGWVRVKGRPTPFSYEADVALGRAGAGRPA